MERVTTAVTEVEEHNDACMSSTQMSNTAFVPILVNGLISVRSDDDLKIM